MIVEDVEISCPWCGETFETTADCSAGDQDYVEDCPVCCRPIELHIECGNGALRAVQARRENE